LLRAGLRIADIAAVIIVRCLRLRYLVAGHSRISIEAAVCRESSAPGRFFRGSLPVCRCGRPSWSIGARVPIASLESV